jgi:PAS domain S-box-containing protein
MSIRSNGQWKPSAMRAERAPRSIRVAKAPTSGAQLTSSAELGDERNQLERNQLAHLYRISKLFIGFDGPDATVPQIVEIIAEAISIRSVVLVLDSSGHRSTCVWTAPDLGRECTRVAAARAQASHAYFVGMTPPAARSGDTASFVTRHLARAVLRSGPQARTVATEDRRFVVLPLVAGRRPSRGVLQIEPAGELCEGDIAFVNAVANQLAAALDQRAATEEALAIAEARRLQAERRWETADAARHEAERGKAEAEERHEQYAALVDNLDQAIVWQLDPKTMAFSYVSARAERLLGFSLRRWFTETDFLMNHLHPEDGPRVRQMIEDAVTTGTDQRCEHRCIRADGRVVWFQTGVHVAECKGSAHSTRLEGMSFDVTKAKEAEESVNQQLAFTRAVTESLDEGIVAIDLEERITFFNAAAAGMLGWTEEEVLGKPASEFLHALGNDGSDAGLAGSFASALRAGRPRRVDDASLLDKAGVPFPVSYAASPIREDGRGDGRRDEMPVGAVLAFRTILEAKRSEKRQRFLASVSASFGASLESRKTLSAFVHHAVPFLADVAYLDEIGPGGSLARREVAFARLEDEQHRGELLSFRPKIDCLTPQNQAMSKKGTQRFSKVSPQMLDAIANHPNEAALWRRMGLDSFLIVPLVGHDQMFGALTLAGSGREWTAADVALAEEFARRAGVAVDNAYLHEETQTALRQRDDILAVVSHDLRCPLNVILLSAESLIGSAQCDGAEELTDATRETVGVVKRSAERMARMIDDLLDVASIDAGHLSVERRPRSLRKLVTQSLTTLRPLGAPKGIDLQVDVVGDDVMVSCDRGRILQVLSNLVGNAIKFTPPGGTIVLHATPRSHGDVLLAVADTGPGIPEHRASHVFDKYWKAPEGNARGTGLGLYISKHLIEAHGGTIWLESKVGKGTTFFFTLPWAEKAVTSPTEVSVT